jgi:hypothetical protein
MVSQKRQKAVEYVLPARTFRGTPEEILPQLDELLESLMGFRRLLLSGPYRVGAPRLARATRRRRSTKVLALHPHVYAGWSHGQLRR